MSTMTRFDYTVRFLTPAFLGDAEQSGRWRTPPVKHLLREWWRVVYATDKNFSVDVGEMRREEGLLFGNAWLENSFCKSRVRLRLSDWKKGSLARPQWPRDESVSHPEVTTKDGKPVAVGSSLYLGYGPLEYRGGRTSMKADAAIDAGKEATLSVAFRASDASSIERALWLMDRYGTLGGRSRNGWGSFTLMPINDTPALCGTVPARRWEDALKIDWPHAIGEDDKGALIWQTAKGYDDWKPLMHDLAIIKIGLRTQFVFPNVNPPHPQPLERHWLSYPITRHTTQAFDRKARLPNCLRFKVRPTTDHKLVGIIVHVPCRPPRDFSPNLKAIQDTWETVHQLLDELTKTGSRSYAMITDVARRGQLKPSLDQVHLKRIAE